MMRYNRRALTAEACRMIVVDELSKRGPLSAHEMYAELSKVFPKTNFAIFASALMKEDSGICVVEGVIDLVPKGLAPRPRHVVRRETAERKVKKRKGVLA